MFKRKDANNLYSTFVFFDGQYECFYENKQFAGFIPIYGKNKFKKTPENQLGLLRVYKENKIFRFLTGRIEVVKKVDGFYASVSCQASKEDLPQRTKPKNGSSVGIDFGNKRVITLSDGSFKDKFSPKVKHNLKKLWLRKQALQKSLSNKEDTYRKMNKLTDGVPLSNNYKKLLHKLRNTELDMQRIREFCGHALTNEILDSYETIYVEDIKTAEIMEKDSTMSKKVQKTMKRNISHNAWGQLKDQLVYKGDWRGNKVSLIPARNSTQTCSNCNFVFEGNKKLTLKNRKYICPECGMEKDRDLNAATNIHNWGIILSKDSV
jgi:putative transposase